VSFDADDGGALDTDGTRLSNDGSVVLFSTKVSF